MSKSCPRCGGYMSMDLYKDIFCANCGNREYPIGIDPALYQRVILPKEGRDNYKRSTAAL